MMPHMTAPSIPAPGIPAGRTQGFFPTSVRLSRDIRRKQDNHPAFGHHGRWHEFGQIDEIDLQLNLLLQSSTALRHHGDSPMQ
jgi:hypothetical protein